MQAEFNVELELAQIQNELAMLQSQVNSMCISHEERMAFENIAKPEAGLDDAALGPVLTSRKPIDNDLFSMQAPEAYKGFLFVQTGAAAGTINKGYIVLGGIITEVAANPISVTSGATHWWIAISWDTGVPTWTSGTAWPDSTDKSPGSMFIPIVSFTLSGGSILLTLQEKVGVIDICAPPDSLSLSNASADSNDAQYGKVQILDWDNPTPATMADEDYVLIRIASSLHAGYVGASAFKDWLHITVYDVDVTGWIFDHGALAFLEKDDHAQYWLAGADYIRNSAASIATDYIYTVTQSSGTGTYKRINVQEYQLQDAAEAVTVDWNQCHLKASAPGADLRIAWKDGKLKNASATLLEWCKEAATINVTGDVDASGHYEVDGVQVVGNRGAHVHDATVTVGSDIGAFTDPPTAAEMGTLRTFVNALKADNAALTTEVHELKGRLTAAAGHGLIA